MPSNVTPAVNIVAGLTSSILPPSYSDIGNSVTSCVIFNNSPQVILVNGSFGQSLLQPNTADLFPCPGITAAPIVSPVGGSGYVGTARAIFYFHGDTIPTNYPIPLASFPGGSFLNASGIAFTTGQTITVTPPEGTNSFGINGTSTGGTGTVAITGSTTGKSYGSFALSALPGATITVGGGGDTSYVITVTVTGGNTVTLSNIFAQTTPAIPVWAGSSTGTIDISAGGTTTILSNSSPIYLFGWSVLTDAAPTATLIELRAGATAIDYFATATWNSGNGRINANQPLNGLRVTGNITTVETAGGPIAANARALLRYAPGP